MIFINYRQEDTKAVVTHLREKLTDRYGLENVFVDYNDIPVGERWSDVLRQELARRVIFLAVIGVNWGNIRFAAGDKQGSLRLDDSEDWVRQEICTALRNKKHVIVILVDEAKLPEKEWGCELDQLPSIQQSRLRNQRDFNNDFTALCGWLEKYEPALKTAREARLPRRQGKADKVSSTKITVWSPAVLYPLQPAPQFAGREKVLEDLTKWAKDVSASIRVFSLIAAGGTGKTAIAERVLTSLDGHTTFGIFVWSFYENPRTESFLREACTYFTGQEPKETGALLECLQRALSGTNPHLLILDGLELVQAAGDSGRRRGEIEDPLLKRLLQWIAAGHGTRVRALITSRFSLPDLQNWKGDRFHEEHINDLPLVAAVGVLRGWGVKGTDVQLLEALRPLQDGKQQVHALSVSVLGSYIGKLWNGDVAKAPTFDREVFAANDPKAAKLTRILTSYAEKLPAAERDLLARLSLFPRGITLEIIGYLIEAGGEIAGKLIGYRESQLLQLLEELRDLGLIFRYDTNEGMNFTAHPFLREFFKALHGVSEPKQIHETIRAKLAPSLKERPDKKPTDPMELDRYERLIEVTRLAGQTQQAFDLFWFGMGYYAHLGAVLGEYARGLRIVSGFSSDGTPNTAGLGLPDRDRCNVVSDWGVFALNLGDLGTARRAFELGNEIDRQESDHKNLAVGYRNLTDVELLAGRWSAAQYVATNALKHAEFARDETGRKFSHGCVAAACVGLGRVMEARQQFHAARKMQVEPHLYSLSGIQEAEFKLVVGDRAGARTQTEFNQSTCHRNHWTRDAALCENLLGYCVLPENKAQARQHLASARTYASHSGNIEIALRCYQLAAEIARYEQDYSLAISEAMNGIQQADSCEFGRWSIDIRLELAKVYLAADNPKEAIDPAAKALEMSEHPDCQYAWGIADGLHLLGVAHARLGEKGKARDFLQRAIEKCKALEHAGLKETEAEFARLMA